MDNLVENEIGSLEDSGNVADALAAGMALASVKERIYKQDGITFYKNCRGELEEVKALTTTSKANQVTRVLIEGVEHFIRYLKAENLDNAVMFYSDQKFTCVLDYTEALTGEGLRLKTVTMPLRLSPELQHWNNHDGCYLTQKHLAEFIEERLIDVVEPDGAVMLDIVNNFQATNKVSYSRAQKLNNGQVQLTYNEDIEATGGSSKTMTIPDSFELGVPVFKKTIGETSDNDPVRIKASFRYRLRDGDLFLKYILRDLNEAIEEELNGVYSRIADAIDVDIFPGGY